MKCIQQKTNLMLLIEKVHNEKVEEILRQLYVDNNMTIKEMAEYLGIGSGTVHSWLKQADITARKMGSWL